MKKRLVPCGSCRRHVRTSERSCPFCAAVVAAVIGGALALVGCDDAPKPPPTATAASADLSAKPSAAPSVTQSASVVTSASAAPATSEPIDPGPPVVPASTSVAVVKPKPPPMLPPDPRPAMKYGIAPDEKLPPLAPKP